MILILRSKTDIMFFNQLIYVILDIHEKKNNNNFMLVNKDFAKFDARSA